MSDINELRRELIVWKRHVATQTDRAEKAENAYRLLHHEKLRWICALSLLLDSVDETELGPCLQVSRTAIDYARDLLDRLARSDEEIGLKEIWVHHIRRRSALADAAAK